MLKTQVIILDEWAAAIREVGLPHPAQESLVVVGTGYAWRQSPGFDVGFDLERFGGVAHEGLVVV